MSDTRAKAKDIHQGGVFSDALLDQPIEYKGDSGSSSHAADKQIKQPQSQKDEYKSVLSEANITQETISTIVTLVKRKLLGSTEDSTSIQSLMAQYSHETETSIKKWIESTMKETSAVKAETAKRKESDLDKMDERISIIETQLQEILVSVTQRSSAELELFKEAQEIARNRREEEGKSETGSEVVRLNVRVKQLEEEAKRLSGIQTSNRGAPQSPVTASRSNLQRNLRNLGSI